MSGAAFQEPVFTTGASGRGGFDARSLPPSRAKRSRSFVFRLLLVSMAGLACTAAIMGGALERASTGTGAPASPPAPPPAWIEIAPVSETFRLEAPEFAKEPRVREARRHRTGGGRQDMWVFGDVTGVSPFLRLVIYKVGDEIAPNATFFVDLARRAAEIGHAITRSAQPAALATRFGNFEVADLNLIRNGAVETPCLGFRFAADSPNLRITGFACGGNAQTGAKAISKAALGCLIDRLELSGETGDPKLDALFAAREPKVQGACSEAAQTALIRVSSRDAPFRDPSRLIRRRSR